MQPTTQQAGFQVPIGEFRIVELLDSTGALDPLANERLTTLGLEGWQMQGIVLEGNGVLLYRVTGVIVAQPPSSGVVPVSILPGGRH